jgi:hypothetical protein
VIAEEDLVGVDCVVEKVVGVGAFKYRIETEPLPWTLRTTFD